MDADHLDIYGTKENMEHSFAEFAARLKPDGILLTKYGLADNKLSAANHIRYSLQNDVADAYGANITTHHGGYRFSVATKDWMLDSIQLNMGGMHNVENAVAAIVIAHRLNIDADKIRAAVMAFQGVKRRFEYVIAPRQFSNSKNTDVVTGATPDIIFIDDYAHHPQELQALISGAKSLFNKRKCTIIFQPHLFSRTKDFAKDFAESLDRADEVLILPIYPARELPVEGVSSDLILRKMKNKNSRILTKEKLLAYLGNDYNKPIEKSEGGRLLITAGAGDIDQLVEPIKKILLHKTI
jgi:UDP-N-acetylmuramate--alanine ligase